MLDITDPHWSTWPACIAVKAAMAQGTAVGERYLRRLRRAALTERAQVQNLGVQMDLAHQVRGFDVEAFRRELESERPQAAFHDDLGLCAAYEVTGFPTMLFRSAAHAGQADAEPGILVGGHRSLATYERILAQVMPGLARHGPRSVGELLAEHGPLTTREIGEITGQGPSIEESLHRAAAEGRHSAVAGCGPWPTTQRRSRPPRHAGALAGGTRQAPRVEPVTGGQDRGR